MCDKEKNCPGAPLFMPYPGMRPLFSPAVVKALLLPLHCICVSTNGICMTGGGSLVWGFDKLIESHTGIETHVADDAISCVAYGTGKSLDDVDSMQDGTINLSRRKQMN